MLIIVPQNECSSSRLCLLIITIRCGSFEHRHRSCAPQLRLQLQGQPHILLLLENSCHHGSCPPDPLPALVVSCLREGQGQRCQGIPAHLLPGGQQTEQLQVGGGHLAQGRTRRPADEMQLRMGPAVSCCDWILYY